MFDQLLTAKNWLQEQAFIVRDWWLEQIIALKVWMIVSTLLGTTLLSSLTTYGIVQLQQTQPKPIPACPVPIPCPVCVQHTHQPTPHPVQSSKLWNYKPLGRSGRSYQ